MIAITLLSALALAETPPETTAQVHQLENGLTVILEEARRTDTVALHLHYGVGARDEQDGEQGCAHLFEHLMFEGSRSVPGNSFDSWLTTAGGSNNAWTSEDATAYHMTFPSGATDLALFIESDRMGFLRDGLTSENLTNQQSVVLQERAEGYDGPNGRDLDALNRLAFPEGHPYHIPIIGTIDDITGFELEGVRAFWERFYRPRNATLAIVGNFEHDAMLERIQHWFSDVPDAGPAHPRVTEQPKTDWTAAAGMLEDSVEDYTVYLSWPTVPLDHPDAEALEILSWILNYGRGTRLDDALYYNSNLASAVSATAWQSEIDGQFVISASTARPTLPRLVRKIERILDDLRRRPPAPEELEKAVRIIQNRFLDTFESPEDRAEFFVDCQRRFGTPNCASTVWDLYAKVTADDIRRVTETYLRDDHRVTLSVVPLGEAKAALRDANPVVLP